MPSGASCDRAIAGRLIATASAWRTRTSLIFGLVPLMVRCRKFGLPAVRSSIPSMSFAAIELVDVRPTSIASISPLAKWRRSGLPGSDDAVDDVIELVGFPTTVRCARW